MPSRMDEPPEGGTFFYVRHDRMNPTLAFRLGDDIIFFGEDPIRDARLIEELPASTEYWGPLPEPPEDFKLS